MMLSTNQHQVSFQLEQVLLLNIIFDIYLISLQHHNFIMGTARQIFAVYYKNWMILMDNKKKIGGDLAFPLLLTFFYYLYKDNENEIFGFILKFILMFIIGQLNSAALRHIVSLFVVQREQSHRQYQVIMGLTYKLYTFSNLTYVILYYFVAQLPFFIIVNYYEFSLLTYLFVFLSFSVSAGSLTLMLTALFNDHKVASEVIGFIFSMAAFLPFFYKQDPVFSNTLIQMVPNSSFTISILSTQIKEKLRISAFSLMLTPLYIFIYYVVEYNELFQNAISKICTRSTKKTQLTQQIQLQSQSVYQQYNQDEQMSLPDAQAAIRINKVTKTFGDVDAVNKLSLNVPKFKILGLLGRNGAGKTTLVDMITKVTKPTCGAIDFCSVDASRPKLGICYQKQILYDEISSKSHLKFFSMIKSIENYQQKIDEVVEKVGFQQHADKKIKELSGGNKRKLSVSLALLGNPQVIIFDEPTSGLDPLSRRNIWDILDRLKHEDTTVLLTTHHLDEADYLSDRICVIEKGKKIIEDSPQRIKHKYGQGYYLSIYFNDELESLNVVTTIDQVVKEISMHLSDNLILEKEKDYIKYFINQSVKFEKLIDIVSIIEEIKGVRVTLQRNSLEQSFISIITQNQRHVLENNVELIRPIPSQKFCSQVLGVIIKNFYCFIRKYYGTYCLTLIIFFLVLMIDIFLLNKLKDQSQIQPSDQQAKHHLSSRESKNNEGEDDQFKISSLILVNVFILMTSSFIAIPMQEKEKKIIQLLRTRGVTKLNYWLGHFLFDMTYFVIACIVMRIVLADMVRECPIFLVMGTGVGMILFAYCGSLLFSKQKTAVAWFTVGNFLLFVASMPFISPVDFTKDNYYRYMSFLKYVYPYFDFTYFLIANDEKFQEIYKITGQKQTVYHLQYVIPLYISILFIFESNLFHRIFKRKPQMLSNQRIIFDTVSKNYGTTEALKNVSYSIDNERVALLGHNGAGKSTTFQMLSSQLNPTSGQVYLENRLKPSYQQVLNKTGICYQDNTLWECLSADETFKIFSWLLNIPEYEDQKKEIFENLQFEYNSKSFNHLSGGNKRKLCLAICLMGSPETRLLDQCSTGLDPISRFSMVKTIKKQRPGSTVFTTHSIPEAEDLCSRSIIMKNGVIQEDDKIYKIKQKYYDCFWVYFMLQDGNNFDEISKKVFSEWNTNHIRFNKKKQIVQVQKHSTKLSKLMRLMDKTKVQGVIQDFKIDEPKLQDVYLKITHDQQQQVQMMNF